MARTKVNSMIRLKEYVEALQATYPGTTTFNRKQIDAIGKTNMIGQLAFGSKQGYGYVTKIGYGMYSIPAEWLAGKAPWTGIEAEVPVASAAKTPKTPKVSKEKVAKTPKAKKTEVSVTETAVVTEPTLKKNSNPKKSMSKKELFEKAKAEIAKRKAKTAEVGEGD